MKLRPRNHNSRHLYSPSRIFSLCAPLRQSSTWATLAHELKTRPLNITYDSLAPTPSHLLNISLRDFLPSSCNPEHFNTSNHTTRGNGLVQTPYSPRRLQQGHHLVYFPPAIPNAELLPDGTDTLHSPRAPTPFTRRLWAGGSVNFNPLLASHLYLSGSGAACVEGIRDVTIKGKEGDEKVFVHIERRYGKSTGRRLRTYKAEGRLDEGIIESIWKGNGAAVVETRNLVFLRAREIMKVDEGIDERVVKRASPACSPDRHQSANLV